VKSVTISMGERGSSVTFKGWWRRADVDAAYRLMLMKLPAHVAELRRRYEDGERAREQQTNERPEQ
jgi:hypothetical protein